MPYSLFQGGRRRRRRSLRALPALLALVAVAAALTWVVRDATQAEAPARPVVVQPLTDEGPAPLPGGGTAPAPLGVRLDSTRDPVDVRFKRPPRAALLFDLDTGEVLWRCNPTKPMPIASLTKLMTALVVTERVAPEAKVRITKHALDYGGSGVGVLPLGKKVGVGALLHGLLLPSGNDAARALAEHTAGSLNQFIALMNTRARRMGLSCTHFTAVDGLRDRGNHSCPADLAAIARAVQREPRLAKIVRRRQAVLPFPIKGGRLYLYNSNPLLRQGYRGTLGMKTGYTDRAGRCLVATARRGQIRLGVVLLHSPDPGKQAMQLLDRGFRAARQ